MKKVKKRQKTIIYTISNNRGSAMITALVVGLVIFAFCLSMLLVAYTLFAQTSRSQVQLGCKNLAQSTAEEIRKELDDPASYEDTESISYYLKNKSSEIKQLKEQALADNSENPEDVDDTIRLEMSSSDSSIDSYSIFITFEFESSKIIKADIECYRDFGNLQDVQSYTVHTEYELKR